MRLITAHKILIACGIGMFLLYGGAQTRRALDGDSSAWLAVALSVAVCIALATYLRWLLRARR
jgi:hypothetical protein